MVGLFYEFDIDGVAAEQVYTSPFSGCVVVSKSDRWIRHAWQKHEIEPFEPARFVNPLSELSPTEPPAIGYDVRCAGEFKIFTNINSAIVDPKNFDDDSFVDLASDICIIPRPVLRAGAHRPVFSCPTQRFDGLPGQVDLCSCNGVVNDPMEPEWEGRVTLRFQYAPTSQIYANERRAQMLFYESDEVLARFHTRIAAASTRSDGRHFARA